MSLTVDVNDKRPIYQQIVAQVTYAVAAGTLAPGDGVPSVRDLSAQILVNPNTVARAYRDLQSAGVLQQRRGLGLFVRDGALGACRKERIDQIRRRLQDVLGEAVESDLPPQAIERLVAEELRSLVKRRKKE